MKDVDYLAGVIDSRGCFTIRVIKNEYKLFQFKLSSKSKKYIRNIRKILKSFGINTTETQMKDVFTLWVTNRSGLKKLCNIIIPYLRVRRKEVKMFLNVILKEEAKRKNH